MSISWTGHNTSEDHPLDLLPKYQGDDTSRDVTDSPTTTTATATTSTGERPTAKIKALDGLRGVACLLVFNYHFLWPWTPLIMLGYGARPPQSPEPVTASLWQLPIACLLHRGRPMVAIFFAISGYVLVRHVQRDVLARRPGAAYAKLASAAFRRVWRLYVPCAASMLAVCVLAQARAFRSEQAIYAGPDSVWINGTTTVGWRAAACPNATVEVLGRRGVADALGLWTASYLNETIKDTDRLCLNMTSELRMPASLYLKAAKPPENGTAGVRATAKAIFKDFADFHHVGPHKPAADPQAGDPATAQQNFTWVQLGGSWEEHPLVHPHVFKALANFTVVLAEWANPFEFKHMHPRYDPHVWTIPKELRGSMVLYTFLLATATLQARWRLAAAVALAAYALTLGFWDMGVFVGGMVHSELDLLRAADPHALSPADRSLAAALFGASAAAAGRPPTPPPTRRARLARAAATAAALYLLSYPDAGAESTPGFRALAWLAPRWYAPGARWMFWQALGALLLLPCALRSRMLRGALEGALPQRLGRASFALYLVHGPVLHGPGFWLMPRLFERLGRPAGYATGYAALLGATLWLSALFERRVDVPSLAVGRRLERMLANP